MLVGARWKLYQVLTVRDVRFLPTIYVFLSVQTLIVWLRRIDLNLKWYKLRRSTFIRIVKHRSTEDFDSLPYVSTLLNSSLWTYYGLINDELLVSTVNGFGVLVQIVYVALFLAFAPRRMKVCVRTRICLIKLPPSSIMPLLLFRQSTYKTLLSFQNNQFFSFLFCFFIFLNLIWNRTDPIFYRTAISWTS